MKTGVSCILTSFTNHPLCALRPAAGPGDALPEALAKLDPRLIDQVDGVLALRNKKYARIQRIQHHSPVSDHGPD